MSRAQGKHDALKPWAISLSAAWTISDRFSTSDTISIYSIRSFLVHERLWTKPSTTSALTIVMCLSRTRKRYTATPEDALKSSYKRSAIFGSCTALRK